MKRERNALLTSAVIFNFLFLYTPIVVLIVFSFNASELALNWKGFTLRWYFELFRDSVLMSALESSLVIGVLTAIFATAFGTALAIVLERGSLRFRKATEAVVVLPILIPEIVMAISLLFFFARFARPVIAWLGFELDSFTSVVLGHIAFNLSYVVVVVRTRLVQFDKHIEEAAAILGATPLQTLLKVTVPMLSPAIISGALLALSLSLDDFYISYFASGGGNGFRTLPLHLYALQAKAGITPQMNAIASIMLALSLVTAGLALYFGAKSRGKLV